MTLTVAQLRWLADAPRASVVRWAAGLTDAQKRSVLAQIAVLERQSAGLRGCDGMGSWLSRAIRSVRDVVGGVVSAIPVVGPLLAPILGSGSSSTPQPREGDTARGQDGRTYVYRGGQWVAQDSGTNWMPIVLVGGGLLLAVTLLRK